MKMYYDKKKYYATLTFDDIFESEDEFAEKVGEIGNINAEQDLKLLYNVLSYKYINSQTRYTDEFSFIMALKRELYTEFPFFLKKKALAEEMMEVEIDEVRKGMQTLMNTVETHDEPISNASTVAIDDLSTQQQSIKTLNNKLEALRQKYNVMNRNYLMGIYRNVDPLFRVILGDEEYVMYAEGDYK